MQQKCTNHVRHSWLESNVWSELRKRNQDVFKAVSQIMDLIENWVQLRKRIGNILLNLKCLFLVEWLYSFEVFEQVLLEAVFVFEKEKPHLASQVHRNALFDDLRTNHLVLTRLNSGIFAKLTKPGQEFFVPQFLCLH